jgi:fluoroacetyl-CoA thioesterase
MKPSLIRGLKHSAELTVTPAMLVPGLAVHLPFHDMPPVFATAMMVGFVEATCIACLRAHLDVREHTVGTQVDVSHIAPTPGWQTRPVRSRTCCRGRSRVDVQGGSER